MRRLVTLLVALTAALSLLAGTAAPARAGIGPKMVQVTAPGFWPACVVITGEKKVYLHGTHVGNLFNKFLLCSGKRGKIQELLFMKKRAVPKSPGRLRPHSHHWRAGRYRIPGQPNGGIAVAKVTFTLYGEPVTSRVCIRARGASRSHGFWSEYCNGS